MNEEYLPPESEQNAMTVPESSDVETSKPFIRIQCSSCSKEVGMDGTFEDARRLLEFRDWKVGREIFCPDCVKKTARKFFKKYSHEHYD